jgi:hypothetical protein
VVTNSGLWNIKNNSLVIQVLKFLMVCGVFLILGLGEVSNLIRLETLYNLVNSKVKSKNGQAVLNDKIVRSINQTTNYPLQNGMAFYRDVNKLSP